MRSTSAREGGAGTGSDYHRVDVRSEPQVYFSHQQVPDGWFTWFAPKDLILRAYGDPANLLPALRRIVAKADPQQPISDVQMFSDIVEAETAPRHFIYVFSALSPASPAGRHWYP